MKNSPYKEWSDHFKSLRASLQNCHNKEEAVNQILEKWAERPKGNWVRSATAWGGSNGFRKNTSRELVGEQIIEKALLGTRGSRFHLRNEPSKKSYEIFAIYHNFPMTSQSGGQVVCDGMGVVVADKKPHPLMIEVKVENASPSSALIQCLQQVKLARAGEGPIREFITRAFENVGDVPEGIPKGAWGMVVAPPKYFEEVPDELEICRDLLNLLKDKTEARIALVHTGKSIEEIKEYGNLELTMVLSNWA